MPSPAPFLFFNGNTFAEIARTFSDYLFAELPAGRRREATSSIAHFVAGVLDRDAMASILTDLCIAASFGPGDRVKTFRGSARGVVVRLHKDGRVIWRPDEEARNDSLSRKASCAKKPREHRPFFPQSANNTMEHRVYLCGWRQSAEGFGLWTITKPLFVLRRRISRSRRSVCLTPSASVAAPCTRFWSLIGHCRHRSRRRNMLPPSFT